MKKFKPASPDDFLIKGADMSLAKFGHLNAIIDGINKANIVSGSGATVALNEEQSGSVILFDRAAGITVTLPSAKVGLKYTFIVTTDLTSNSYKVITNSASQFLQGTIIAGVETTTPGANPGPKLFSGDGSNNVSITMDATTKGALKGTRLIVECISSTVWHVSGISLSTSPVATPFANS